MASRSPMALALLLVLGALTACTPAAPAPSPEPTASPFDPTAIPCDQAIDALAGPPPGYSVLLDSVGLPVGRKLDINVIADVSPRRFAKQGLVVRAGTPVELRIPADWEGRAWIEWGNSSHAKNVITVPPCPDRGSLTWLVFAGGFFVDEPACLPIIVRTAGREETARIGVGTDCALPAPS